MAKGSDERLLQRRPDRRCGGWYFVMAVPRNLRGKLLSQGQRARDGQRSPGKALRKVVISLGTHNLREAQGKRAVLEHHWSQVFERARRGMELSPAEIEEQAREIYVSLLESMADNAKRGLAPDANPEPNPDGSEPGPHDREIAALSIAHDQFAEALEEGDYSLAATGLAAVQRRTGTTLKADTETYRATARAVLVANMEALVGRMKALRGKPSEPPVNFLGSEGIDPVSLQPHVPFPGQGARVPQIKLRDGTSFREASERFLDELQRDRAAKLNEHTRRQYQNCLPPLRVELDNGIKETRRHLAVYRAQRCIVCVVGEQPECDQRKRKRKWILVW